MNLDMDLHAAFRTAVTPSPAPRLEESFTLGQVGRA